MPCKVPYKFVDQEEDDVAEEVVGGGFVDLFSIVDLAGNFIMRLNRVYREHHHLVLGMEV